MPLGRPRGEFEWRRIDRRGGFGKGWGGPDGALWALARPERPERASEDLAGGTGCGFLVGTP